MEILKKLEITFKSSSSKSNYPKLLSLTYLAVAIEKIMQNPKNNKPLYDLGKLVDNACKIYEFYLDFCNTSSLLLRLHYQGVDVEQRMRKLQPLANYFCEQQLIPFIDYHLILFYKYFDDTERLQLIKDGVSHHYENTKFQNTTSSIVWLFLRIFTNTLLRYC